MPAMTRASSKNRRILPREGLKVACTNTLLSQLAYDVKIGHWEIHVASTLGKHGVSSHSFEEALLSSQTSRC